MIHRLQGILIEKTPPYVLLDVHGVGYEVEMPSNSFYRLPELGSPLILHTYLSIREDAHLLYGFQEHSERTLFKILLKINGIGPKLGLSILSTLEPRQLLSTVQNKDYRTLQQVPGIGKKMLERLMVELGQRLENFESFHSLSSHEQALVPVQSNIRDALQGLLSLGYKPKQAEKMLKQVQDQSKEAEELILMALRGSQE